MMDKPLIARIRQAYAEHPLSAAAIRTRLRERLGEPLPPLTELDLAVDLASGVTDQNHTGGLDAVVDLARPLGATPGARLLDVGSGLGGPARLLALLYKCSVVGVELADNRYLDAVALTELVGLNEHVRFVHGDFLRVELPPGHFDGVILLDSFGHFPDKPAVLKRCLRMCRPGGRAAIQEVTLLRPPRPTELDLLAELASHWNVYFASRDDWLPPLTSLGRVEDEVDLHVEWRCHNERLLTLAGKPGASPVAPREKRAWELSLQMSDAGLLGYARTVLSRL